MEISPELQSKIVKFGKFELDDLSFVVDQTVALYTNTVAPHITPDKIDAHARYTKLLAETSATSLSTLQKALIDLYAANISEADLDEFMSNPVVLKFIETIPRMSVETQNAIATWQAAIFQQLDAERQSLMA